MGKINRVAGPTDDFLTPGTDGAAVREDAEDLTDADAERSEAEDGPTLTQEAREGIEDWEDRSGTNAVSLHGEDANTKEQFGGDEFAEDAAKAKAEHDKEEATSAGSSSPESSETPATTQSTIVTDKPTPLSVPSTAGRSKPGQKVTSTAPSADTSSTGSIK